MTGEPWRLGSLEATTQPTPKASRTGSEQLLPGEIVVAYVAEIEGEGRTSLKTFSRTALLPIEPERTRSSVDVDGKVSVTFSVRGAIGGQGFEAEVPWFTADAAAYQRATHAERSRAIANSGAVPRLVLTSVVTPSVTETGVGEMVSKRRVDYGNGRSAVITDGKARRVDFDDGDSVTITEMPDEEAAQEAARELAYGLPDKMPRVEIFDRHGCRIGLDGTRYRPQDAMPAD